MSPDCVVSSAPIFTWGRVLHIIPFFLFIDTKYHTLVVPISHNLLYVPLKHSPTYLNDNEINCKFKGETATKL